MNKDFDTGGNKVKAIVRVCLFSAIVVLMLHAGESKAAGSTMGPQATDESQYVGSEACKNCHEDRYKTFETTTMGKVLLHNPKTQLESKGCEACHGPGRAHVEDVRCALGGVAGVHDQVAHPLPKRRLDGVADGSEPGVHLGLLPGR